MKIAAVLFAALLALAACTSESPDSVPPTDPVSTPAG